MAIRTFSRLYDNHDDALQVVEAMEQAGFRHEDVSLVASNVGERYDSAGNIRPAVEPAVVETESADRAGAGAGMGAAVGAGAGLLAGIGMIAIPGIGPIVAAGWLATTLAGAAVGAAAGGLVGSLVASGVPEEDANLYAEGIRRGSSLVTVRADESRAADIERIFAMRSAVDPAARRREYQDAGWRRFDPAASEYRAPVGRL
jgi:hypothetical protein